MFWVHTLEVRVLSSLLNQGTYNNNKSKGSTPLFSAISGRLAQWLEHMICNREMNKVPFYFD